LQENRCALYALEALTLLATALTRLEVGTLGVAAFGGARGARVLHPLGTPWTDAAAQGVLGALTFEADNTLRDTPVLRLLQSTRALFDAQRVVAAGGARAAALSQLLLIVADGRFHERDALRRAVREATATGDGAGGGLLIVFIILDTKTDSVLELRSVSFENGEPIFRDYLEGFPFPYYLLLQDIQHLPRLLADLLKQWMAMCAA
jgi:midasin